MCSQRRRPLPQASRPHPLLASSPSKKLVAFVPAPNNSHRQTQNHTTHSVYIAPDQTVPLTARGFSLRGFAVPNRVA